MYISFFFFSFYFFVFFYFSRNKERKAGFYSFIFQVFIEPIAEA